MSDYITPDGHGTGAIVSWTDVPLSRVAMIDDLRNHPEIIAPLTQEGEPCPWPWDPQLLPSGTPMGQYHCPYCGEMCVAGMAHPDYRGMDEDYQRYMEEHGGQDQPVSLMWPGDPDHDSSDAGVVQRELPEGTGERP